MNWDAIGAVGDLIGGAAVAVTLVFLIVQLRQLSTDARFRIHPRSKVLGFPHRGYHT